MYEKFLRLLEKTNTTAGKVAKATNINRSTFSHWKNGDYTPKIETLQKIADYFGVPVSYFYGDEEEKPSYYLDDETARIAQLIHDDPELRALFSADKKVQKETLEQVKQILKIMKGNNQ